MSAKAKLTGPSKTAPLKTASPASLILVKLAPFSLFRNFAFPTIKMPVMSVWTNMTGAFEHRIVERGVTSDFHADEAGSLFLVLKLCPVRFEIAGDVRK